MEYLAEQTKKEIEKHRVSDNARERERERERGRGSWGISGRVVHRSSSR
jgi:hypothetical protein